VKCDNNIKGGEKSVLSWGGVEKLVLDNDDIYLVLLFFFNIALFSIIFFSFLLWGGEENSGC
jgi:hypothetical protein